MAFSTLLTSIIPNMTSSLISKSVFRLLQLHSRPQISECHISPLHDVRGLFKMPEEVSLRWTAHISRSWLGLSVFSSLSPLDWVLALCLHQEAFKWIAVRGEWRKRQCSSYCCQLTRDPLCISLIPPLHPLQPVSMFASIASPLFNFSFISIPSALSSPREAAHTMSIRVELSLTCGQHTSHLGSQEAWDGILLADHSP